MENDRIVAAAKREARRRASADGTSLQKHLEEIAQEAGRSHWSTYLKDPVELSPNPLDRLVRECFEDGYDGMEIEHADYEAVAWNDHGGITDFKGFHPAFVKAFAHDPDGGPTRIDLYRLGYEDLEYLSPSLRKRLKYPTHNAAHDVPFGDERLFLYCHFGMQFAFAREEGSWQEAHRTDLHHYDPTLELPFWRGRVGRPLAELAADERMHARRVSRLALVLASPQAPAVRYDPFALSEVPIINEALTRAHFRAVADLVLPDNADLAIDRHVFAEVATRRRGQAVRHQRRITIGLRHMSSLMLDTPLIDGLPPELQHLTPEVVRSSINRISTKMIRFSKGALADAVDGLAHEERLEREYMAWSNRIWKEFARAHPGKSNNSPEHEAWMEEASRRPDAVPIPWSQD